MTKRVIWIIVIILITGYFINNYLENKAKKEAEKTETERIEKDRKEAIAQLVKRTNAVDNWEKDLNKGKQFRLEPILTVELERLWLTNRPILFIGDIKDIATIDEKTYRVKMERSSFIGTELQLILQCQKQTIDTFLKEHPDLFKDYDLKNGVAVIAEIDEIETKTVSGSEGEKEEIKVGKGKCVDILYRGDVHLTHNKSLKRDEAKSTP